jgi:transcriptional regulator with XRE-family HTH domain
MYLRIVPDKMGFCKGELDMNQQQARVLGNLLRAKRKELGFSTYQLAAASGVNSSTVVRIELGKFAAPGPDKLAKFATALKMNLAEIYAKAGYIVPEGLPDLDTYLITKYPDLSKSDLRKMQLTLKELRSN